MDYETVLFPTDNLPQIDVTVSTIPAFDFKLYAFFGSLKHLTYFSALGTVMS